MGGKTSFWVIGEEEVVVGLDDVVRRDLLLFEGFKGDCQSDLPACYSAQFQQGASPGY